MDCDVLVIGAGVLGLSSAYYMKIRNPSQKILVVDRFSGPGQGNSAKSEGGFRNVFTSEVNYLLSESTIDWFKHLENDLGYDLKLHFIGYLWLFSETQYKSVEHALTQIEKRGTTIRVFNKEDLNNTIPSLVTDLSSDEDAELLNIPDVHVGVFGPKCGSLDTDALVKSYEEEFLKAGGEIIYNTKFLFAHSLHLGDFA